MEKHLESRILAGPPMSQGDRSEEEDIWLGDFNRHNPWWEDASNSRLFTNTNLEKAQILIDLLTEHNMDLALPPAIPMILNRLNSRGARTRPDNVSISEDISNWVTVCDTLPDHMPPRADHFPIITHISFLTITATKERPWNFKATDWDRFKEALGGRLEDVPANEHLQDEVQIDAALHRVETAILDTMTEIVPKSNPTPYSKRWWTKDLDKARKLARTNALVARKFMQFPRHSSHEKARRARNDYNALIDKFKRQHWENWLENISDKTLWDAHRFILAPVTDGSKTRIPTLKVTDELGEVQEIFDNEGKSSTWGFLLLSPGRLRY